jgi:hypothetical protein
MKNMNPRVKVLKQLVADEMYDVDATAIADAMLLRATMLRTLPDVTFRCRPSAAPVVRSFRPHRGARSFRLTRAARRPLHVRGGGLKLPA